MLFFKFGFLKNRDNIDRNKDLENKYKGEV